MAERRAASRARPHRRLVAGLLVVVAGGGLASGVRAAWTAAFTLPGIDVTAGRLDLTLDGALVGPGGSTVLATVAAPDLTPGESVAHVIEGAAAGDVAVLVRATATADGALAPHLRVSVHPGGTASNTVTDGVRSGSCSGVPTATDVTLGAAPSPVIGADLRIDPGTPVPVCVRIALAAGAPASAQGQSATVTFVFAARSVGAPP